MQSRLVWIAPTLMMIAAVFFGLPWLIMGLGLNTVLLLWYLSMKRYKKKGFVPPYNYMMFLKYFLSYIILASSLLFVITLFHRVFFISLAVSTLFNCIYVVIYAIFYFFTKRKEIETIEEDKNRQLPVPVTSEEEEEDKD